MAMGVFLNYRKVWPCLHLFKVFKKPLWRIEFGDHHFGTGDYIILKCVHVIRIGVLHLSNKLMS